MGVNADYTDISNQTSNKTALHVKSYAPFYPSEFSPSIQKRTKIHNRLKVFFKHIPGDRIAAANLPEELAALPDLALLRLKVQRYQAEAP